MNHKRPELPVYWVQLAKCYVTQYSRAEINATFMKLIVLRFCWHSVTEVLTLFGPSGATELLRLAVLDWRIFLIQNATVICIIDYFLKCQIIH